MAIQKDKLINADKSRTNQYYLDGHYYQYDLGWIVDTIMEVIDKINNLYEDEIVHYADPIQWDITAQYTKNTVVVNPQTGTAYISKQPVPTNILLDNTDYWLPIFNYAGEMDNLRKSIGALFTTSITDKEVEKGMFVWYGGLLYRATANIPANTVLLPGSNIERVNVDEAIKTWRTDSIDWNIKKAVFNYENMERHTAGDDTATAGSYTRTADDTTLSAKHFHIQSTETPLQYGQPKTTANYATVDMTAEDGTSYKLMVENTETIKRNANKVVFVGDSYGTGLTPNGEVTPWVTFAAHTMGLSDSEWVNVSLGGIGFTTSLSFLDRLKTENKFIKSEVKAVVVCGGYNDKGSTTDEIKRKVTEFVDYVHTTYPNARTYCGMIGNSTDGATRGDLLNIVRKGYMYISELKNCAYLSNSEYILHDYALMSTDGLHPTQRGYEVLGAYLGNALNGCGIDVFYPLKGFKIKALGGGITSCTLDAINQLYHNDIATIIGGQIVIATVDFTWKGNDPLVCCTIDTDSYILGSNYDYVCGFPCIAYIQNTSGQFESLFVRAYFVNNTFCIRNDNVSGSGFKNYEHVKDITLRFCSCAIPADYA